MPTFHILGLIFDSFFVYYASSSGAFKKKSTGNFFRLHILYAAIVVIGFLIIVRLFILMVLDHGFYQALAAGSHDSYAQLFPKRGSILIQDSRSHEEYPLAMNKDVFVVYADTREIHDDKTAEAVANVLAGIFNYPDEKRAALMAILNRRTIAYKPIEQKVNEETVNKLKGLHLPGIAFSRKSERHYPEENLAASVVGFVGKNDAGQDVGRYGVEGYWHNELAGRGGFLEGSRGATGGLIPLAGISLQPASDGANILLSLDRSLQYYACERLRAAAKEYEATSASLVILEPATGAIRAMCGLPDFDPNSYNTVDNIRVYNNSAIFSPYEPGSIFKPITMSSALNEQAVAPSDQFFDHGSRDGLCTKPIKNAGEKSYGEQSMTGILQNSINTGMVYVVEKLGKKKFSDYVSRFGFGDKEGLELDTEVGGTIESLSKNKSERLDCYTATGAFGQGLTVTPLQMATAFGVLANGGALIKPYIVEEIRYSDGRVEHTRPKVIRQVISQRAATLITGMLVQVVDRGYGGRARVHGYYVAGKTGTAQIPGPGGYTEDTNHSFVGYAPAEHPKFVMIVKFEKPKRTYAEVTAAPVFSDIAKFALQYYQIPPER